MTTEAPLHTTAGIDERALAEALTGLCDRTPATVAELATLITTMETLPQTEVRSMAAPAAAAERLAVGFGRRDLEMRARLVRADALQREGDTAESGRLCHQVQAWAAEHRDEYVLARCHSLLCTFFRQVGDMADALAHAVQSVAHSEDIPAGMRARHLNTLAVTLEDNGSRDEAFRRFQEALEIASATDDAELALQVLNNMAFIRYEDGDEAAAQELVNRMRAVSARHCVPMVANYLDTVARVEMMVGRYAEAEEALRPVTDGSAGYLLTDGNGLAECLLTLAEAQRLRGDMESCQATLNRAVRVCEKSELASHRARVREEQAVLYAETGCYREAYEEHRRFYQEAQALQSAQREVRARAMQAAFELEEARRTSEEFREMAHRDPLTRLYNRRLVNDRLPVLLNEAAQRGTPLSVALLDIDYFKRINDTLSHEAGDVVLQRVAEILTAATAAPAFAARMGGEEFLVVLPDMDRVDALRLCEGLRVAIRSHPWRPITGDLPVTTSIGLTTAYDEQITQSALLAQADRNLYAAKRSGRDRVVADPI